MEKGGFKFELQLSTRSEVVSAYATALRLKPASNR